MKFFRKTVTVLLIPFSLLATTLTLNFQDTPIEEVIEYVAKETGNNILITDRITGKVNFISNKPIHKEDLLPLLMQILQNRGYTLVKDAKHGYLMVTRAANAKKLSNPNDSEAGMVTRVIGVHYIKASEAVQKLRYLTSQFASATFDNNKKIIILTDYPVQIENFITMLHEIDRPMKKEVRFIELLNAEASTAARDLKPIFKSLETSLHFPVTITPDPKSNKLIVIADKNDIATAVNVIKEYDSNNKAKEVVSDVIFLNNAEASATVKILSGLLKSFDKETRSQVSFQAKEDINAIAITGRSEAVKLITKVIKKLDIEQQQVYIKAHIYEISQRKMENLGIKWGMAGGGITGNALLTGSVNMGGDVFALPNILQGALNMDEIEANVAIGAVIDLLKQNGAVNVVSEPNILCINNKKSTVYIGKTISILTSTVQGNQTTDLARNTYSREDIGLTLEVKPQIASDNKVLLEVKTKLEDIDQASTTALNSDRPTTFKREVQTVAIVRDGENVIIGGLLKDYYSKGETKVPLFGDLPLFGPLFRSKSDVKDQINVVVILTPYIIKNSQSLAEIQTKIAETEKLKSDLAKVLGRKLQERQQRFQKEEKESVPSDVFEH